MDGSDLVTGKLKVKVQDAYSMRSTPQVIGALRDALAYARTQFEIELNGVADNPIFVAEENRVLTGANFQGTPISLPLDMVGAGLTMVSRALRAPPQPAPQPGALASGCRAFLTKGAGMFSGPHAQPVHRRHADRRAAHPLARPSCIQSIPAAADQEDFVSMGMNGALKTKQILDNAYGVLAIELIAAAQALDFREFTPGKGTRAAQGGRAQGGRAPRRGPPALPRPQRDDGRGGALRRARRRSRARSGALASSW